jgi:hypothetical protein
MGDTVFVNGRAVIHRGSAGKAVATFPDVCKCPPTPPAGPVPTPLPNTAVAADVTGCAGTVFVEGNPIAIESSYIGQSTGNEVSQPTGGGVVTSATRGKAYFVSYSMDVLVEGKGVPRHLDLLTQNHASPPGNTPPGVWLSVPGAPVVLPAAPKQAEKHSFAVVLADDLYTTMSPVQLTHCELKLPDGSVPPRRYLSVAWIVPNVAAGTVTLRFTELWEARRQAEQELTPSSKPGGR